jgi:HSP20 family protein
MNKMTTHPDAARSALTQAQFQGQVQDPVRQLFERMFDGGLFGRAQDDSSVVTSQWAPAVDIHEEPERFVLYADLPGVDPQDIEVQMDRGLLTIKGERRAESPMERGRYSRVERLHGVFHRRFALPDSADPEGISASGHDGVLQVVIPKRPESKPRRIQVGTTLHS